MYNIENLKELQQFSNPYIAQQKAFEYLGPSAILQKSTKKNKKYMVYNPNTNKYIHFGQMGYEDYTKHNDDKRRQNYLKRTENMRGEWKHNPYSANNLSRHILW
jgi:hypothetical protein